MNAPASYCSSINPIVLFFMEFDGTTFVLGSGKQIDMRCCLITTRDAATGREAINPVRRKDMSIRYGLTSQQAKRAHKELLRRYRNSLFAVGSILVAGHVAPAPAKDEPRPTPAGARAGGFTWPSTNASPGEADSLEADAWPQVGLLSYVGYSVGESGRSEPRRRAILAETFERPTLPPVHSPRYLAEWGASCSGPRLKKMAESIASFCRNSKRRRSAALEYAITQWESDLAWLRRQFYDGRFDRKFPWPRTDGT